MYRKLEAVGSRLLALFVPSITASADSCSWRNFPSCWQCDGFACQAFCCDGDGCGFVICANA